MMYQDAPIKQPPKATQSTGRLGRATYVVRRFITAINDFFAWNAGVDLRALANASAERPFYSALGGFAFFFSCVSGLMIMVAVAYASGAARVWDLWWVGILGMAVVISMERLVLQIEPTAGRKIAVAAIPRVVVSLLIANFVSSMLVMAKYTPEIRADLAEQTALDLRKVQPEANRIFGVKIEAAKDEIARLTANEQKVEQRIARQDLRAQEAREPGGACTARCDYFRALSQADRKKLAAMNRRNRGRFEGRRAQMADLRADQREFIANRRNSITQRTGLIAREESLNRIKKKTPSVARQVVLFHILLVVLDLLAFTVKLLRLIVVGRDAYHAQHEADRNEQILEADVRNEHVATERSRIRDFGRANRRSNRAKADFGEFCDPYDPTVHRDTYTAGTTNTGAPIDTYGLLEATEDATDWEKDPVAVPPVMRRGALFGFGVLAMSLLAIVLFNLSGFLIALPAVILAGIFLAQTQGFRTATATGLRGTFATFLIGAAFPLFLLIHNL